MLKPILMGSATCAEIADRTATAKTDAAAKSERTRNARNINVLPVLLLLLSLDRNTNSHEFDRSFATQSSRLSSRSEEHTSELQSLRHLVCRLLLEKKN